MDEKWVLRFIKHQNKDFPKYLKLTEISNGCNVKSKDDSLGQYMDQVIKIGRNVTKDDATGHKLMEGNSRTNSRPSKLTTSY